MRRVVDGSSSRSASRQSDAANRISAATDREPYAGNGCSDSEDRDAERADNDSGRRAAGECRNDAE
jgi:hypothetical protein